jgi:DNA polymerase III epsilon subunit-like protein
VITDTKNRNLLGFDFETSGTDTETCQILQIGAAIVDGKSYNVKDTFATLVKPEFPEQVEKEALAVNHLKMDDLMKAPSVEVIFHTFAQWTQKFNVNKQKNTWGAPIGVTFNGASFDIPILKRYCKRFGYWDKKWNNQTLINPIFNIDVMQHIWLYMKGLLDLPNTKLTTICEYMGVSKEEIDKCAHDAVWDVKQTLEIGIRLLKMADYLTVANDEGKRKLEFRGCLLK